VFSRSSVLSLGASLMTFLVTGAYVLGNQTDHDFRVTLPFLVLFGFIQCGAPILMQRLNPMPSDEAGGILNRLCQLTPLVTLVLVMLPMLRGFYGFSIWPTALLINVLLIGAAVQSRSAFLALGASAITFLLAAFYIVTLPMAASMGLNEVLVVVLGFGGFFSLAAVLLGSRLGDQRIFPATAFARGACEARCPSCCLVWTSAVRIAGDEHGAAFESAKPVAHIPGCDAVGRNAPVHCPAQPDADSCLSRFRRCVRR
jgi:hypothetical protein